MKKTQNKVLLSSLMICIPLCILSIFFIVTDIKISDIPSWAYIVFIVAILISPLLFFWQLERQKQNSADNEETTPNPFKRTLFFFLFVITILTILFILNKSFAWVMLACFLPLLFFFLYDDFKRNQGTKN